MAESLIKWKKGDYIKLGQAVSRFNKRINELEVDDIEYLPDLKNYEELKESILSRKELNRVINSLRKFSKTGMGEMIELPSGELVTKWEYSEIKLARNRALKQLQTERVSIEEGRKWRGMGDERLDQIDATIESITDIENVRGSEFKRKLSRLFFLGKTDIELVRAKTFKENFMNAIEEMSTYDNYNILFNKLASIKNPISFYNYVRNSDVLMDLFLYYKDKPTAQTYGGFESNQDAFNYALEELGLLK